VATQTTTERWTYTRLADAQSDALFRLSRAHGGAAIVANLGAGTILARHAGPEPAHEREVEIHRDGLTRPAHPEGALLPRVGKAAQVLDIIGHHWRLRTLAAIHDAGLRGEPTNPKAIAGLVAGPVGTIAYHVRALHAAGLIEHVRDGRARGAAVHFYRLTQAGQGVLDVVERLQRLDA
jgi:DNA-binding HxlR family transcriptional regulator